MRSNKVDDLIVNDGNALLIYTFFSPLYADVKQVPCRIYFTEIT